MQSGIPLGVYLRDTTNRQQRTIEAWCQEELNNPSRSDFYLMQIAQMLYQQNRKGTAPSVDKFAISFRPKNQKRSLTPIERQRAIELSKARWTARTKGITK